MGRQWTGTGVLEIELLWMVTFTVAVLYVAGLT